MAFPVALAAMMAMSAAKAFSDKEQEKKDRQYQAEVIRNSPWTGMRPDQVRRADTFGTMAQGVGSGMAMDQSIDANSRQNALLDSQKGAWDRSNQPAMTSSVAPPTGNMSMADGSIGGPMTDEQKFSNFMNRNQRGPSFQGSGWPGQQYASR